MLEMNLQFFGGRGGGSGTGPKPRPSKPEKFDVQSSTSLISLREDGKQVEVDETLEVFRDVADKYGAIAEDLQVAKLGKGGAGVLAFYDMGDNVSVNERFFDKATMEKAYASAVAAGYHPSNGDKTGLQAVIAHELGHKLNNDLVQTMGAKSLDDAAFKIVSEAAKRMGNKFSVANISGYAKDSDAESVAEAFADVYCNGSRATRESRAIVEVIDSYSRKR